MIDNEEDLTDYEIKQLASIEKRLIKIAREIKELGFNVALHDGNLAILKGDSHTGDKANYENIKCQIYVGQWSSVDW